MARLNHTSFGLNSVTALIDFVAVAGSPTISTSTVRTGGHSLRISSLSSGTVQAVRLQFATSGSGGNGPYFGRQYLNIATYPSAENRIISSRDSVAGADKLYITLDSGGLLRLYNGSNVQVGSASSALSLGTWYRVEWRIDRTPAGGSQVIEGTIDGSVFATSSTQTIAANVGDLVRLGGNMNSEAQTTGDWFFDDVAINDSTGAFQNTYPGSGKILHLKPNAAGDVNTFGTQTGGTAGAANNFSRVSEQAPDDATTFNGSNTLNQEDLFNIEDSGMGASDTVNVVSVGFRFRNNTADATTAVKAEIEKTASGTISQSASIVPNNINWKTNDATASHNFGSWPYPIMLYQDPDAASWTQTTIDSMQIGYKLTTGGSNRVDITKVWAEVDYTPSTTSPSSSLSPSASTSPSASVSPSASLSPSSSVSASISPSASVSPSSSISASISPSASLSPSSSISASISPSASVSPSSSVSASLSPSSSLSASISPSSSRSPSSSASASQSPSSSLSPSASASLSLSPSSSVSASTSPSSSASPSSSISPSSSSSSSLSPSSSVSPSPSHTFDLPTNNVLAIKQTSNLLISKPRATDLIILNGPRPTFDISYLDALLTEDGEFILTENDANITIE